MTPLACLAILAAAMQLTLVATAAASAPTSVDETFHRSIPNFISCPGFTVRGEFDVSRTVTTFYDSNGSPIRQATHVHFTGTLTNNLSGKTIDDAGNQIVDTDLADGNLRGHRTRPGRDDPGRRRDLRPGRPARQGRCRQPDLQRRPAGRSHG
jgi:hypothetical protein